MSGKKGDKDRPPRSSNGSNTEKSKIAFRD